MITRLTIVAMLMTILPLNLAAQIVTTSPSPVQSDSRNIIITFHADQGNRGLAGVGPAEKVYAHTGVITNKSASPTDWQYAPAWLDNSAKYEMKYVATDTWQLSIPDIRSYYGITDDDVTVSKLMFVFRNANGTKEGKTSTGGDIAVEVMKAGLQISLSTSAGKFNVINAHTGPVTLTADATSTADLEITVNGESLAKKSASTSLMCTFDFEPGTNSTVIATAVADNVTVSDTAYVCTLASTISKEYPAGKVKSGLVDNGDTYLLALAAPGKKNVVVTGSWNDFQITPDQQMFSSPEKISLPSDTAFMKNAYMMASPYYWISLPKTLTTDEFSYFFIIDGEIAVSDPYATLILDPDNDRYIPASVFEIPTYPSALAEINVPLSWHTDRYDSVPLNSDYKCANSDNMVIYELLLRDFTSDADGTPASGTLSGAVDKLDYIASLGVDAIELMPVMEFGGNNSWGYNPNFYLAPDKAYGTPDDYRRFVNAAHDRGLAVILDVVFNQADSSHPWWAMFEPSENPFFNASAPHAYNVLNDWNQGNPLVEQQWIDALTYWLTQYGVDGFRFDLVKGLGDNGSYASTYDRPQNTFGTPSSSATDRFNATRIARMGRLHAAISRIRPDVIFINEDLATAAEENALAADGDMNWANINNACCQFAMGYQSESNMNRFYAPLDDQRLYGSTVSYAESHDEERMAYKQSQWAPAEVKGNEAVCMRRLGSVAAQMLMTPGAHMIWQFQELGDAQPVKKADGNNDTSSKRAPWSLLDNSDHRALKETYSGLMEIRKKYPELFCKETIVDMHCSQSDWTQGRSISLSSVDSKTALRLCVNPNTAKDLSVAAPDGMEPVLSSPEMNLSDPANVIIPAGGFVVFATKSATGVDAVTGPQSELKAIYDLKGQKMNHSDTLPAGYYIKVFTDGSARKVYIN